MALGKRKQEQQEAWVATSALPKSPGHPFYRTLNQLLAEVDFDRRAERICAPYYAENVGRPSIPPGCVLPHDPHRVFRGDWLAAWHCMAM